MTTRKARRKSNSIVRADAPALLKDVRQLIVEARTRAASAVNTTLTRLHWLVGKRIGKEILKGERAEYGEAILVTLSQELSAEFGDGYSYSALTRMVRFADAFPDERVISELNRCRGVFGRAEGVSRVSPGECAEDVEAAVGSNNA